MPRRRPLLILVLLLLLALGASGAFFLATFDLNDHRARLEERLGRAADRPVRLGEASFTVRHGLGLQFADVEVGQTGENGFFRAERLLVLLSWKPLLQGKLHFDTIRLEEPHLLLRLPSDTPSRKAPGGATAGRLEFVRALQVKDGVLTVEDARHPQSPPLKLTGIRGELTDLAPGQEGWLRLSGTVRRGDGASPVVLIGEVEPPAGGFRLQETRLQLGLVLEDVSSELLPPEIFSETLRLQGRTELQATVSGTVRGGLQLTARLPEGILAAPAGGGPLRPLPEISAEAAYSPAPDRRLKDLRLQAGPALLEGEATFGGDLPLAGHLQLSTPIPLDAVWPHLPVAESLKDLPLEGHLSALTVDVGAEPKGKNPEWRIRGEISGAKGAWPDVGRFREGALRAELTEGLLEFTGGGLLEGTRVDVAGALVSPLSPEREISTQISGVLPGEAFRNRLPEGARRDLALKGDLKVELTLEGRPTALRLDGRADLTGLGLRWGEEIVKASGRPADLFLTGEWKRDRLEIDLARLRAGPFTLRMRGHRQMQGAHAFRFHLELAALDLKKGADFLPRLKELGARGELHLQAELAGSREGTTSRRGTISLRQVSLAKRPPLAEINGITGNLSFSGRRLEIERLIARIGTSPVALEGFLENFDAPRGELKVHSRAIRANELIFPSPTAVLRDVEGHLRIRQGLLEFDPVTVRLDGGTSATVRGTVSRFDAPLVELDITADYGNIDEVIALWNRGEPKSSEAKGEGGAEVRITAKCARGTLGDLHFQQAEGLIVAERGLLTIHPLRFRAGSGWCTGHVLVEDAPKGSLLKVSGHLEDFDAASIHRELLGRRGLITGTMRGDFYLEGVLGGDFLKTSLGGFNLEVKGGVLRQFTTLARVFSLLNVSQIFTGDLPDMAREGMPFERLSATFGLKEGILSSEDLFIDSEAMNLSLVGSLDLNSRTLDALLGMKPLRTVDKIVTRIPLAGWLLTGEEKALITAHFQIRGDVEDPKVLPVPITSVSEKVVGIFRRVLGLPGHLLGNLGEMMRTHPEDLPPKATD